MSQNYDFQIARADDAAAEAAGALLDNVKQRALRSEAAWREMAERTRKMDDEREKARVERERRSSGLNEIDAGTLGTNR